jgi:competence protein ComGC
MKKRTKIIIAAVGILVFIAIVIPKDKAIQKQMDRGMVKVAEDQIKAYNIAIESGNKMDAYVQAGIIKAAYLQAKDEEGYKKWSEIEAALSKELGMDF